MKILMAAGLVVASIAGSVPAGAAGLPNDDIVIRANVARMEIERILAADNLDTISLDPRDVADRIAAIPKGRAPADFWRAYQRHVEAWQRLAVDQANSVQPGSAELIAAERSINSSFDQVERIARGHGARMPPARAR